jgi:hypothetical protein
LLPSERPSPRGVFVFRGKPAEIDALQKLLFEFERSGRYGGR